VYQRKRRSRFSQDSTRRGCNRRRGHLLDQLLGGVNVALPQRSPPLSRRGAPPRGSGRGGSDKFLRCEVAPFPVGGGRPRCGPSRAFRVTMGVSRWSHSGLTRFHGIFMGVNRWCCEWMVLGSQGLVMGVNRCRRDWLIFGHAGPWAAHCASWPAPEGRGAPPQLLGSGARHHARHVVGLQAPCRPAEGADGY